MHKGGFPFGAFCDCHKKLRRFLGLRFMRMRTNYKLRWLRDFGTALIAKKLRRNIKFIQLCDRSPELFPAKTNQITWSYVIVKTSSNLIGFCWKKLWRSIANQFIWKSKNLRHKSPSRKNRQSFLLSKSAKWKSTFKLNPSIVRSRKIWWLILCLHANLGPSHWIKTVSWKRSVLSQ